MYETENDLSRSRRVELNALMNLRLASVVESTGVLPRRTMWRGPRTAAAGLVVMIWPITIQSNRCFNAARRSFAVGADRAFCNCST